VRDKLSSKLGLRFYPGYAIKFAKKCRMLTSEGRLAASCKKSRQDDYLLPRIVAPLDPIVLGQLPQLPGS
jgi:hypothetical protein